MSFDCQIPEIEDKTWSTMVIKQKLHLSILTKFGTWIVCVECLCLRA